MSCTIIIDSNSNRVGTSRMGKIALLATRDNSGLDPFSRKLGELHGYRMLKVGKVLPDGLGHCETVDFREARERVASGEVSLLIANFFDPAMVGRDFMSWKSALKAFDHEIADLIRSAAKQPHVLTVLGDPSLYEKATEILGEGEGAFPTPFRIEQACNALHAVSNFDASVAQYLEAQGGEVPDLDALGGLPKTLNFSWKRSHSLSGGETARQKAGIYGTYADHFETVAGPDVDYQAVVDSSLAAYAIGEFEKTTALIVQRGELLSAASADDLESAICRAIESIEWDLGKATLAVNGSIDPECLTGIDTKRFSTLIAPTFTQKEAMDGLRLLESREGLGYEALQELRSVVGGVLIQDRNRSAVNPFAWRMPSANQPLVADWEDMIFGVKISRHLRSLACLAVREEQVVARTTGLSNQKRFAQRLVEDGASLNGSILIFDEDIEDPEVLSKSKNLGASVVVHPGLNSALEATLVDRANQLGLSLVATGVSFSKF